MDVCLDPSQSSPTLARNADARGARTPASVGAMGHITGESHTQSPLREGSALLVEVPACFRWQLQVPPPPPPPPHPILKLSPSGSAVSIPQLARWPPAVPATELGASGGWKVGVATAPGPPISRDRLPQPPVPGSSRLLDVLCRRSHHVAPSGNGHWCTVQAE